MYYIKSVLLMRGANEGFVSLSLFIVIVMKLINFFFKVWISDRGGDGIG